MSLDDTMTALMNKVRKKTGITDKISIEQLIDLIDQIGLHVNPNLLSQTEFTASVNSGYPMWSMVKVVDLVPGTYTVSWQASTTGTNTKVRVRIFNASKNITIPPNDLGHEFKLTSDRTSFTFSISEGDIGYGIYFYGSGTNISQTAPVRFYNVKLENGNTATPFA